MPAYQSDFPGARFFQRRVLDHQKATKSFHMDGGFPPERRGIRLQPFEQPSEHIVRRPVGPLRLNPHAFGAIALLRASAWLNHPGPAGRLASPRDLRRCSQLSRRRSWSKITMPFS